MAFFVWFAIAPLLGEIEDSLDLTRDEIWLSSIVSVGGTIFIRFLLGPACDKYGARILLAIVLCASSIPTALTGLVRNLTDLCIVRLFIGIAGGSFVMCQYWTSCMFTKDVVGTANALVGGWGNLGGSVTNLIMGALLFPLFKILLNDDEETAWRTVCIVPVVATFLTGIAVYMYSDDCPKGNYSDLKKHGEIPAVSATQSFWKGAANHNTWVLFVQYACCFGVELTMNNAAALYFREVFGQSTQSSAAIASLFGWMNLFARGYGGFASDWSNRRYGMRGRIIVLTILLILEGVLVFAFANTNTLGTSIVVLIFFSVFVQAAEGATYGIVPYVKDEYTGSISGIVGAGGNVGAVLFGIFFREFDYRNAFVAMGCAILLSATLSFFLHIEGQSSLFFVCSIAGDKNTSTVREGPATTESPVALTGVSKTAHSHQTADEEALDAMATDMAKSNTNGVGSYHAGNVETIVESVDAQHGVEKDGA